MVKWISNSEIVVNIICWRQTKVFISEEKISYLARSCRFVLTAICCKWCIHCSRINSSSQHHSVKVIIISLKQSFTSICLLKFNFFYLLWNVKLFHKWILLQILIPTSTRISSFVQLKCFAFSYFWRDNVTWIRETLFFLSCIEMFGLMSFIFFFGNNEFSGESDFLTRVCGGSNDHLLILQFSIIKKYIKFKKR